MDLPVNYSFFSIFSVYWVSSQNSSNFFQSKTEAELFPFESGAQIHGGKHYYDPAKAALSAFNMSLLPVLYFFSFLYYTDVGSTLMVLLAYCLHLDGRDACT